VRLPAWARVMAILMAVVDFTVAGHRTRDGEDLGFFVGVKALQVGAQDAERFDPRGMLVHFGDQRMLDRSWHHHTTTVEMVRPGRLSPRRQAGRAISRLSPPADPVSFGRARLGGSPLQFGTGSPREWADGERVRLIAPGIRTRSAILVIDHSRWSEISLQMVGISPATPPNVRDHARIGRITQRSRGSVGGPGTRLHSPSRGGRNQKCSTMDHRIGNR
jgi:hypothetical protein